MKNDSTGDLSPHACTPLSEAELCPEELLKGQEEAYARDIERLLKRKNEFVSHPCPACRSEQSQAIFEKFTLKFDQCTECRTIYMNPRPSTEVMADYYQNSENYAYWAKHIFPASEAARREKIHKPWLDRILSYCSKFKIAKDFLLEVGPGFGTFASLATASGSFSKVVGVEPTPEMAQACRDRGVDIIEKRIEEISSEIKQATILVAFEVIEHLFDPSIFIEAAFDRLKPGGLLVLSCPNGLGFDINVLGPLSQAVDTEHVNLFNPESLKLLVESCGFKVLEISTPGRLDAELVRIAVKNDGFDIQGNAFLKQVLIDDWDTLGWPFQQFLSDNGLSSHMWLAAQKV